MKIPHPGSHALVNILHREITINAAIASIINIRTIAIHPNTAHSAAPIPIIAP